MEKRNKILIVAASLLFLVLAGEIYYLFFIKPANSPQKTVDTTASQKQLNNLYVKRSDSEVKEIMENYSITADSMKPLIKSGVAKEILLTHVYKTVITKIGPISIDKKYSDGRKLHLDYELSFATMAESGKKEYSLLFTKKELERIHAFNSVGDERVETTLSSIQVGDYVSIIVQVNLLENSSNSLVNLEIVKLL